MSIKCSTIVDSLNQLIPEKTGLPGDIIGLIIGSSSKDISKVVIALELSQRVLYEAIENKVDLIITYHSIIDETLKSLSSDTPKGKLISDLYKSDIVLYNVGTSLDVSEYGASDFLCKSFGAPDTSILKITSEDRCYKLTTCIPVLEDDFTAKIRQCMGDLGLRNRSNGTGVIGNYSHVCDYVRGIQNFVPMEGTNPFIGEQGVLESVEVDRLEMIVPESMLQETIAKMCEIHPYEEVEYDVFPMLLTKDKKGLGRIGTFKEDKSLLEIIAILKTDLKISNVKVFYSEMIPAFESQSIKKIAVYDGIAGELLKEVILSGAEAFVSCDFTENDRCAASAHNLILIDVGYASLKHLSLSLLKKNLAETYTDNKTLEIKTSESSLETFLLF